MKTVSCKLISSKPISLSKAAKILSKFTTAVNGASPAISAYLSRASDAFDELTHFHNNLNRTPQSSKHRESKNPNHVSSVQPSQALRLDLDGESNHVKKEKKKKVGEEREEKEGSVVNKEDEEEERDNEDSGKKKKTKKEEKKKRKSGGDGEGSLGIEIKEEEERGKKRKSEEIEERRWDGESDETRNSKKAKKRRS